MLARGRLQATQAPLRPAISRSQEAGEFAQALVRGHVGGFGGADARGGIGRGGIYRAAGIRGVVVVTAKSRIGLDCSLRR